MTANRLWRRVSVLLALLAGVFFIGYAVEHVQELPSLSWGIRTWLLLGVSVLLWAGIIFLGAVIWWSLLVDLNQRLNWRACLSIYGIAQFGKYLPGNVGHHVGRVVLAKQAGIPVASTLQTMLIEMAWGVGVASGIALIGIFQIGDVDVPPGYLVLLIVAAMLVPWAGLSVARTFFPGLVARVTAGANIQPPRPSTMAIASFLYLVVFLIVGLLLDSHARILFGADNSQILTLTAIFAWSWIAGYITPGAPAGLGVREAVLVSALTPLYGASVAVGLTVSLRVVTTMGDGLVFLIALAVRRLNNSESALAS